MLLQIPQVLSAECLARCRAKAGNAGKIFGTGTKALFLTASTDERHRHHQVG